MPFPVYAPLGKKKKKTTARAASAYYSYYQTSLEKAPTEKRPVAVSVHRSPADVAAWENVTWLAPVLCIHKCHVTASPRLPYPKNPRRVCGSEEKTSFRFPWSPLWHISMRPTYDAARFSNSCTHSHTLRIAKHNSCTPNDSVLAIVALIVTFCRNVSRRKGRTSAQLDATCGLRYRHSKTNVEWTGYGTN